jgi:hypothetical protein
MSEMIERVAAAMALKAGFIWMHMAEGEEWASDEREARDFWRPLARVAIEAMLNPTEEMLDVGEDVSPLKGATGVWLAMIREALRDTNRDTARGAVEVSP